MHDELEGGERREREGEGREEERKEKKKGEKRGKTWCFSPAAFKNIQLELESGTIPSFNFLDTQSLATMCTVLQVPKKRKGFKATLSLEEMESQK